MAPPINCGILLRFFGARHEEIADLEDQLHGAAIADPGALVRADAIEDRVAGAQVALDAELGRRLAAVAVGDQQIDAGRLLFKILQIADQHRCAGELGRDRAPGWR